VLSTDDKVLSFPGLARSEFDRGLGQHMTARNSAPDFVMYGPVSVQLWGRRFVAGVRFFRDVLHGITLTLEQSKVAAFIDLIRRGRVRLFLGRRGFESRSEVDVVRYRVSV